MTTGASDGAHWVYGIQGDQEKLNWASSDTTSTAPMRGGDFERTYYYERRYTSAEQMLCRLARFQGTVIAYESMTTQGDWHMDIR
jgi:hypothetical protein